MCWIKLKGIKNASPRLPFQFMPADYLDWYDAFHQFLGVLGSLSKNILISWQHFECSVCVTQPKVRKSWIYFLFCPWSETLAKLQMRKSHDLLSMETFHPATCVSPPFFLCPCNTAEHCFWVVSDLLPTLLACPRLEEYSSMWKKQEVFDNIFIEWFLNYSFPWINDTIE